tara:strand:- start:1033 stop:1530 length:498 start_codon:yes stop_codon:yes gene_type:complete
MAFKMKGNPLKMGSMATKSTMKMKKESPMEMKKESPMKKKRKAGIDNKESGTERFDNMMVASEEKATGKNPDAKPSKTAGRKSPMKLSEEDKKKAMDNAMPEARVSSMSRQTMDSAKKRKLMTASGSFDMDKAKAELRRLKSMSSPTAKNDAHQKELTRLIKAFS